MIPLLQEIVLPKLKEFTIDDIPSLLHELRGTDSRFLIQYAGSGYSHPITSNQIVHNIEDDNHLLFKFVSDSNNTTLGYCQLTRINWHDKYASIGRVLIKEEFRGQGLSYPMLEQLIDYANQELKLEKLILRVFDFNSPAKKCYTKLGFKEIQNEDVFFKDIEETWNCITMERS